MADAVIVAAVRTPVGRYGGALKDVRPDDLAALVVLADGEEHGGGDGEADQGDTDDCGESARHAAGLLGRGGDGWQIVTPRPAGGKGRIVRSA